MDVDIYIYIVDSCIYNLIVPNIDGEFAHLFSACLISIYGYHDGANHCVPLKKKAYRKKGKERLPWMEHSIKWPYRFLFIYVFAHMNTAII